MSSVNRIMPTPDGAASERLPDVMKEGFLALLSLWPFYAVVIGFLLPLVSDDSPHAVLFILIGSAIALAGVIGGIRALLKMWEEAWNDPNNSPQGK